MKTIYNTEPDVLIKKTAEELKKIMKKPEWADFVKTGRSKENQPQNKDWYFIRTASMLRTIYLRGPIGVQKLRIKYGSKKNRGSRPERFYKSGGKVIRIIMQDLEKNGLISYKKEGIHKGRIITPKGKSFINKILR